jgi:hypothetical protein
MEGGAWAQLDGPKQTILLLASQYTAVRRVQFYRRRYVTVSSGLSQPSCVSLVTKLDQILEVSLQQMQLYTLSTVLSSINCKITENKAKDSSNYRGTQQRTSGVVLKNLPTCVLLLLDRPCFLERLQWQHNA